jgi:hypothetical protein
VQVKVKLWQRTYGEYIGVAEGSEYWGYVGVSRYGNVEAKTHPSHYEAHLYITQADATWEYENGSPGGMTLYSQEVCLDPSGPSDRCAPP